LRPRHGVLDFTETCRAHFGERLSVGRVDELHACILARRARFTIDEGMQGHKARW
jgi:hypothetical protein